LALSPEKVLERLAAVGDCCYPANLVQLCMVEISDISVPDPNRAAITVHLTPGCNSERMSSLEDQICAALAGSMGIIGKDRQSIAGAVMDSKRLTINWAHDYDAERLNRSELPADAKDLFRQFISLGPRPLVQLRT